MSENNHWKEATADSNPSKEKALENGSTENSPAVDPVKLMGLALKTAEAVAESLPEAFPSLLIPGIVMAKDNTSGLNDKSEEALKANAARGNESARAHLDRYFQYRDTDAVGKDSGNEPSVGRKVGSENSSYDVNNSGDTVAFTSGPTAQAPDGANRKAQYNDKQELVALTDPSGFTFKRVSAENDKGFAYWEAYNQTGQRVQVGSKSGPFVGKLSLDQDGSHIMVGYDKTNPSRNTQWAGMFVELRPDGTELKTTVLNEKGKNPGFETKASMPDGSVVTSRMHFDIETKSYKPDAEVTVMEGDGDAKTVIKNGEIVSQEENLLAKDRMKDLVKLIDSNEQLQNLQHLDVSSTGHGLRIVVDNAQSTFSPPMTLPGVTIDNTIPDFSNIGRHLSLNAQYRPDSHSVLLSDVSGISGRGHQFGPLFGKQWNGNARIDGMFVSPSRVGVHVDSVQIQTGGLGHRIAQRAANNRGPGWKAIPVTKLQEDMQEMIGTYLEPLGQAIQKIGEESKHIGIDRTSKHSFNLEAQASNKLQTELEKFGPFLELGKDVKGKLSYDESAGIRVSELKGMQVLWHDIRELKLEPSKDGKFKITVGFENPITHKPNSISIPEDLARMAYKVMTTQALQNTEIAAKRSR